MFTLVLQMNLIFFYFMNTLFSVMLDRYDCVAQPPALTDVAILSSG